MRKFNATAGRASHVISHLFRSSEIPHTTMKASLITLASLFAVSSALDVKLSGINYNPRKGADWDAYDKKCKSANEIAADMKTLAGITSNIRLYSMTDCNQVELVIPAAKAAGLKVWVGMWIGKDGAGYESEKAKLASLIAANVVDSSVVGLSVGSETVYRKDLTSTQAIAYMKEVKAMVVAAGLKFPVTIADIGDSYMWYPELAAAVDIISINQFPFWEGRAADGAIQFFADRVSPLVKLAKDNNKQIMVGETGWATAGKAKGAGDATPENAAIWLNDFHIYASEQKWTYYYFTSFDTPWKHNPNDASSESEVENYFGLFDAQSQLKPCYAGLSVKKRVSVNKTDDSKPTTTPVNVKPKTDTDVSVNTSAVPATTKGANATIQTNSTNATKTTTTAAPSTTEAASSSSSSSSSVATKPVTTSVPATGAGTQTSGATAATAAVSILAMLVASTTF
ncbi:Aste57867_21211 [Aphanomyces stellatus]|uniref:glucan endo-1,3-beta-D-glucosidase n=1 Tax=Aphanomyces stellatus TaxID=120398 RepID=A0A485LHJ1_9STRA|nr:hypothetical protein As57867_021143 [Aphanomyces stellatus]VFT97884.1 Aste57867_21211 [Aphanomyces stellatus]